MRFKILVLALTSVFVLAACDGENSSTGTDDDTTTTDDVTEDTIEQDMVGEDTTEQDMVGEDTTEQDMVEEDTTEEVAEEVTEDVVEEVAEEVTEDTTEDTTEEIEECGGCVDGDDACQTGDTLAACGGDGEVCDVCEGEETCTDGACLAPEACAVTCDGCCTGEVCTAVQTDDACGVDGGQCVDCGTGTCDDGDGVCEPACEDSCEGCCDAEGVCQDGTADDVCGIEGESCSDCAADSCSVGECVPAACADSCDGCCDGSTCETGDANGLCGSDGDICLDCGPGRACGDDGICEVSRTSRWDVVAINGFLPLFNGDATWDISGSREAPDPYVEIKVIEGSGCVDDCLLVEGTSHFEANTYLPNWWLGNPTEAVVLENVAANQMLDWGFEISVWDDDVGRDDLAGMCTIGRDDQDLEVFMDGREWIFDCRIEDDWKWEVHLLWRPHISE